MEVKKNSIYRLSINAVYIALYLCLMYIFLPFSTGPIQLRMSEILVILPIFDKYSIVSITFACFISNLIFGNILDAFFGAFATFIGLFFTYLLRKRNYFIATMPNIISNMVIIPNILKYAYGIGNYPIFLLILMVGIGEAISVYIFGYILYGFLCKKTLKFY